MKNRLLLLLLPAGAGLGLWASLAVSPLYVLTAPALILLPLSLGFAVQGIALFFTRQRRGWLRFAALVLLLVPAAGVAWEAFLKGMFWQLAAVIWSIVGALYLMGWGAAWALEGRSRV